MEKRYGLRFSVASVLLAASVAFSSVVMASADTKEIAPGVNYEKFSQDGTNYNTIEFKPGGKLKVVGGLSNGYVYGTQNVVGMAQGVEDDPEIAGEVIAAMNADFFTMSKGGNANADDYGVPYAAFISNGQILASSGYYYNGDIDRIAVGIKADGSVVMGKNPNMTFSAKVNGADAFKVDYVNRARPHDGVDYTNVWNVNPKNQIVLYTSDYYTSTNTTGGVEVKVKVSEQDLSHGGKIVGVVEGSPSTTGNMTIEEGYIVLSAMNKSKSDLESLKNGDKIEINVSIDDEKWQDVGFAIGGSVVAAENGEITSKAKRANGNYETSRSRTQVGVKADGTMVWMTADEAGGSAGITVPEMTQMMIDRGCVTVINLDGGGSTQFVGRNDDDTLSLWNYPMNGTTNARHVANAIVLVYDENAADLPSSSASAGSETSDGSQTSGSGTVSASSTASSPSSVTNPGTGDGSARMMLFVAAAMIVLSGGFIIVNLVDYKQKRKSDK